MTREEAIYELERMKTWSKDLSDDEIEAIAIALKALNQEPKTGHCMDCKYFEYDSVAKVDGVPLIVAHEICSRWGDGCKTKEDGYCFLFKPRESEDNT
jgi:hypothetical protein